MPGWWLGPAPAAGIDVTAGPELRCSARRSRSVEIDPLRHPGEVPMFRPGLATALIAVGAIAAPATAQTTGHDCGKLTSIYDEAVKTADTLMTDLVNKAMQGGTSGMLNQLGIGTSLSPEQALQKGALAAISPPAQNAILIYLLRANTAMQEMIWKGCKPPQ
jgi:hypothetical protein